MDVKMEDVASALSVELVKSLALPIWNSVKDKYNKNKTISDYSPEKFFGDYFERLYYKCRYVKTIVFNSRPVDINEIYIPLTLRDEEDEFIVDRYNNEVVGSISRVMIVDYAGMGKSTLVKYMIKDCIEKIESIPVLIELRNISRDTDVLSHIVEEVRPSLDKEWSESLMKDFVKSGQFTFFLDGYDEIIDSDKSEVTKLIQNFISRYRKNKFVITSRREESLSSFADFNVFSIKSLSKEEAFNLIERYDKKDSVSQNLISDLQKEGREDVSHFLTNPLLVSLLYKSYDYKQVVPLKKNAFYRQVYDALFENHDLTKEGGYRREKKSGLDLDDFHKVLRVLGYMTYFKVGSIEYDREKLSSIIEECMDLCMVSRFTSNEMIYDLVNNVPVFQIEGNKFKWSHKSFQEYFAASYICTDTKDRQCMVMGYAFISKNAYNNYNIADLCYDIDKSEFSKCISKSIIKRFIERNTGDDVLDFIGLYKNIHVHVFKEAKLDDHGFAGLHKIQEVLGTDGFEFVGLLASEVLKKNFGNSLIMSVGASEVAAMIDLLNDKNEDVFAYANIEGVYDLDFDLVEEGVYNISSFYHKYNDIFNGMKGQIMAMISHNFKYRKSNEIKIMDKIKCQEMMEIIELNEKTEDMMMEFVIRK